MNLVSNPTLASSVLFKSRMPENIHITRLTGPDSGWPVASYCEQCRKFTITWNPFSLKPTHGDFYLLSFCFDESPEVRMQHERIFED